MRSRSFKLLSTLLCSIFILFAGCTPAVNTAGEKFVTVIVENSSDYVCEESVIRAPKNSDVRISLTIGSNDAFIGIDYDDYDVTQSESEGERRITVTLCNVRYSAVVTPKIERNASADGAGFDEGLTSCAGEGVAAYYAADGTTAVKYARTSSAHLRFNTLTANHKFIRSGYVQTGWNTQADGGGAYIGFGSRYGREENVTLYANWEKACDESHFEYTVKEGKATVRGYTGNDENLVIPRTLGGYAVAYIASNSVNGGSFDKIVLPDTVERILPNAFTKVTVNELFIFDNVSFVSQSAFKDCSFVTFHVNAARAPMYSGTYYDVFADKCDRLISIADEKKIILAAGSTTRFGFDSNLLSAAFADYEIANMGVYAYANMLPEYLIILSYAKEGDVVLSTPEFDTVETQFCTTDDISFDIFAMVEANYDLFARIDCRLVSNVIPAFGDFIMRRRGQYGSYEVTAYDFDEDGVPCGTPSYNKYGDYILPRPNNEEMKLFGVRRACYNVRYFPKEYIDSLNAVYERFTDKGVTVLFEYSPRSKSSITDDSDNATAAVLAEYLEDVLAVPVIGGIADSLMSELYFFGTDNHLSDEGVQIYTERVIEDVKKYFNSNI